MVTPRLRPPTLPANQALVLIPQSRFTEELWTLSWDELYDKAVLENGASIEDGLLRVVDEKGFGAFGRHGYAVMREPRAGEGGKPLLLTQGW